MIREFFGIDGYQRPAEGFLSWQHLTFVSVLMVIMTFLALWLGLKNQNRTAREKNRVLIVAALLLDGAELCKILLQSILLRDPLRFLYELPLFLCSIQLIALPMAAFSRGRLKEACLDFVCIFGIIGAVLGTYCAGNNYGSYPVLSFDNVISGVTHSISGFASLYIMAARMADMKKQNLPITIAILLGFCIAAYIANLILDYNYMFLMRGDGTPYDLLYNLVSGHKVLYPLGVVLLFLIYIAVFRGVFLLVRRHREAAASSADQVPQSHVG